MGTVATKKPRPRRSFTPEFKAASSRASRTDSRSTATRPALADPPPLQPERARTRPTATRCTGGPSGRRPAHLGPDGGPLAGGTVSPWAASPARYAMVVNVVEVLVSGA